MAKLEQGQRAYEAWHAAMAWHPSWSQLTDEARQAWAAVEQACAVTAATQGGKAELLALADAWLKHAAAIRSDEGVVAAAEVLEDCADELLSLAEAGKAQAEWVNCCERMPEPGVAVLCWDGVCVMLSEWDRSIWADIQPTHWMPLPSPPSAPEGT